MSNAGDDESLDPAEVLYVLCNGDITKSLAVNALPAEDVYRWMLIKLRCLQRASTAIDSTSQESFD